MNARRWRTRIIVGVALYAIFLVVAPFEHHDLICHLKNPLHCTSCASSLIGADPQAPVAANTCHLDDAGSAVALNVDADGVLLAIRSTGRSPPL